MSEIGAFEAKTHLPKLLKRVQAGERIVITKHGHPIAELVPYQGRDAGAVCAAIRDLTAFRRSHRLGQPVRELIEEGRRY